MTMYATALIKRHSIPNQTPSWLLGQKLGHPSVKFWRPPYVEDPNWRTVLVMLLWIFGFAGSPALEPKNELY